MSYYDEPETFTREQVAPLVQELDERRKEDWKRKAQDLYPNATPLLDLVQANSEESYLEMAKDMSERLSGAGNPGVAGPTRYSGPPVTAGMPALPPQANLEEELADAKRRARSGDESAWADALRLVREKQSAGY